MVSRIVLLAAILGVVWAGPQSAPAALFLSITVDPEEPRALEPVQVEAQTLAVFGEDCLAEPGARATPMAFYAAGDAPLTWPFELTVLGPAMPPSEESGTPEPSERETFVVVLLVSDRDPTIWEGEVVFPAPGEWTLRVTFPDFGGADPACTGHEETVTVLPASPLGSPDTATPVTALVPH